MNHIYAGISTANQAMTQAVYFLNPRLPPGSNWSRRSEPNWIDPSTLIKLATHFAFSNRNDIYAALSYQPDTLRSLPELRNFFAHKNLRTFKVAMGLVTKHGVKAGNPEEIIFAFAPGRPQTLLQDWIDDLVFMVEYLCK